MHSSFDDGVKISFPHFTTTAILGCNDIYLDAVPCKSDWTLLSTCHSNISSQSKPVCHHLTHLEDEVKIEPLKVDNILNQLRHYYNEIKTNEN